MPKNRDKSTPAVSQHSDKKTDVSRPATPVPVVLALGFVGLLVALVATGMLTLDALGLVGLPGCGVDQGCGDATSSVFGKLPLGGERSWPVSFLGFAYFTTMAVGLLLHRRSVTLTFKGIAVLGALGSIFYMAVMALNWGDYFCKFCLASHIGNMIFVGAMVFTRTSKAGPKTARTLGVVAGTFVLSTVVLIGVQAWAGDRIEKTADIKGEQDAQQIIEDAKRRAAQQNGTAVTPEPSPNVTSTDPDPAPAIGEQHGSLPRAAYRTDDLGFTGRYRLGPKEAKIRLVVYSSFGCPSCIILEDEIMEILEAREDVSYSHKHFPLDKACNPTISRTIHPKSCEAAQICEAVGELYGPVAFWRFHHAFFEKLRVQEKFTGVSLLDELGYPGRQTVLHAKDDPTVQRLVRQDVDEATALGLRMTPTIFINGVEFRAWNVRGSLTRRVDQIASQIQPSTPELDQPAGAFEKYVEDYTSQRRRLPSMGEDLNVSYLGEEDAPIDMQVFFGYETDNLAEQLWALHDLLAKYPEAVRMTVRHYAWSEDCNFFSERNRSNNSCEMHSALEAAAIMGGNEAFQRAYQWLLENIGTFDVAMLPDLAGEIGVDPAEFQRVMDANETQTATLMDAEWLHKQKMRAAMPIIFINKRRVERYVFQGNRIDVLEAIVRRELGLEE